MTGRVIQVIIIILLAFQTTYSQDSVAQSLTVGNKWVFKRWQDQPWVSAGYNINEVIGDTIINNQSYSILQRTRLGRGYFRADSHKIYEYLTNYSLETVRFDFGLTDTTLSYGSIQVDTIFYWGKNRKRIEVTIENGGLSSDNATYIYGIGNVVYEYHGHGPDAGSELVAGIIDGVIYGDTTLVSVKTEEPPAPEKFVLQQNYPNPFNPETKIGFKLFEESYITLEVINTLGEKVATIAEGYHEIGSYEVTYNAGNLPSGVFYYRLSTGGNYVMKKMILLR